MSTRRSMQILRYFRGDFGEGLYRNVLLSGAPRKGKTELMSCLALYADGDFPYIQLANGSPGLVAAMRHVLGLSYPGDVHRAESQSARIVVAGSPEDVDDVIWETGVRQVQPYELPVILITWMRMIQSPNQKTLLWFPSMTRGSWALARIQRSLTRKHNA